ncbi:MAG TPA: CDP-diacylglycerol--serine O-phosphatidyltransferase, partial [Gemmatimonadota bacterium]|nr:CDP-diacylglycerol--serine O-phosphatidyltransferase [Gemmatimonadota bacterium]
RMRRAIPVEVEEGPPRRRRGNRRERLRSRVHLLPHLFTLGNLFAGFFSVSATLAGDYDRAAIAIGAGIVLDGLDGAVARLVSTSSPIGVQLDSLADVVTFGVAPAILALAWGAGGPAMAGSSHVQRLVWIATFAFVSATALRLARFNVMTTGDATGLPPRKDAFIGMPTPVSAAVVAVHVHLFKAALADWPAAVVWAVALLVLTGLMVSRVAFPNVKRFLTNPRSPHLLMIGAALLIAAVYFYSEIVLYALVVAYLAWAASYNLRLRRAAHARTGGVEEQAAPPS